MAQIPDKKTDYEVEYPGYVQPIDYQKPVITALIEGIMEVVQTYEENLHFIVSSNNIVNATGKLLDHWGELVGEDRDNRSDGPYRTAIRAKIRENRSNGTWPDLIAIARSAYGDSGATVSVADIGTAEASMIVQSPITSDLAALRVFNKLDRARPAGVKLHYYYWPDVADNVFTLGDINISSTLTSTSQGLSDLVGAQGGGLAGVQSSQSTGLSDSVVQLSGNPWGAGFGSGFGE